MPGAIYMAIMYLIVILLIVRDWRKNECVKLDEFMIKSDQLLQRRRKYG